MQYDVPGLLLGLLTQAAGFAVLATLSQRLCVHREEVQGKAGVSWWALAAAGAFVGGGVHYAACGWIDQERGVCGKVGVGGMYSLQNHFDTASQSEGPSTHLDTSGQRGSFIHFSKNL